MKKCLNIPNTDKILWDKIVEVLTNSVKIKDVLKEKTLIGSSFESLDLKQILELNENKIHELTLVKNNIERGLVEVESRHILQEFTSEQIYKSIKKNLTKKYQKVKS
ncbi:MAG: hypothetical protein P1P79_07820, partial [Lutibacter sp.]|nr:hypothetical protein [Lutibacter sp.]